MLPSDDLAGRHALVTGAGRGIGRAAALALAEAGAGVTLAARSPADLEAACAEIAACGGEAHAVVADVTAPEDVARLVAAAREHGPLSICVTAAGINRPGPSVDLALDDFDAVLATNVRGTWLVVTEVARAWLAAGQSGSVVALSSQMGAVGYPGRAAYCASKHAVNGLTRALAVEWAPHGITVNAVAPTFIRTPMTAPMLADPAFRTDVERRLPGGAVGEVGDVVGAIVFLAGDRARLVNGHVLAVDGGWTAW